MLMTWCKSDRFLKIADEVAADLDEEVGKFASQSLIDEMCKVIG